MSREHEIVVMNDECCEPYTTYVGASRDLPPDDRITAVLQPRPAQLTVNTDPPSRGSIGVVELDPDPGQKKPINTSGQLGKPIYIFFTGDRNMSKKLLLTISAEGKPPENHEVEIRAGARESKEVKLGD